MSVLLAQTEEYRVVYLSGRLTFERLADGATYSEDGKGCYSRFCRDVDAHGAEKTTRVWLSTTGRPIKWVAK